MTSNIAIPTGVFNTDPIESTWRRVGKLVAPIVNLVGSPKCGKTSLIAASLTSLLPDLRVGALLGGTHGSQDADRLAALGCYVVEFPTDPPHGPDIERLHKAISDLELLELDLVFLENLNSILTPFRLDIPNLLHVAVFSVEMEDAFENLFDQACNADAVVLNKIDLLPRAGFDVPRFHAAVARLNPMAIPFEFSATQDWGMEPWVKWLSLKCPLPGGRASAWFG